MPRPIIAFAAAAAFPLCTCISTPRATPKTPAAHRRGRSARRIDGTPAEQSTEHRRNNVSTNGTSRSTEHRRNIDIDGTSNNLRTRPAPNLGGAGPRRHRKGPKATTTQTEKYILRFDGTPLPPAPLELWPCGACRRRPVPAACGNTFTCYVGHSMPLYANISEWQVSSY